MAYVQYGSGHCAPTGWLNFDASVTLRLERIPVLGTLIRKNSQRFPENVTPGDIVKGLPVPDGSADGIYASHVLEHLPRGGFFVALSNTYRMLRPGGVFRLIVPDLEARARQYVADLDTGCKDANDKLFRSGSLGMEAAPVGLLQLVANVFGGSKHHWMWDYPSMESALKRTGFVLIRRCEMGDSGNPMFSAVESRNRFFDENWGIRELAIHCEKPELLAHAGIAYTQHVGRDGISTQSVSLR